MTAQPKKINVAVVGLGFMGMTHLRAYLASESARVAAVCGVSRLPVNGVLQGVKGNIKTNSDDIHLGPGVKVFRRIEDLLADGGNRTRRSLHSDSGASGNSALPRSRQANTFCAKSRWRGLRKPRGRFCEWPNRHRVF